MRLEIASALSINFARAYAWRRLHHVPVVAASAQRGRPAPEGRHLCSSGPREDKLRRSGIGTRVPPLRGLAVLWGSLFLQGFRSYGAGSIARWTDPPVPLALKTGAGSEIRATRPSP